LFPRHSGEGGNPDVLDADRIAIFKRMNLGHSVVHWQVSEGRGKLFLFFFRRHEAAEDKAHGADDERTPEGGLEPLYTKADVKAFGKP